MAQVHPPVLGGADDDEVVLQNGPAVKVAGGDAKLVVLHGNVLGRIAQLLKQVWLQQARVGSQVVEKLTKSQPSQEHFLVMPAAEGAAQNW